MIQIKDRLYDAQLFAITMPLDNPALRLLPAESAFVSNNFVAKFANGEPYAIVAGQKRGTIAGTNLVGVERSVLSVA